jgi:hypothetical protein
MMPPLGLKKVADRTSAAIDTTAEEKKHGDVVRGGDFPERVAKCRARLRSTLQ